MHNTLFITVGHLDTGTIIRKLAVNFSYYALICETITLITDTLNNKKVTQEKTSAVFADF